MEDKINEIVDEGLKNGRAILFIGLEALDSNGYNFFKAFYEELPDELKQETKYFQSEKLWSFSSTEKRRKIISELNKFSSEFFKQSEQNRLSSSLLKLLSIKMPLIINLLPNNFIHLLIKEYMNDSAIFDYLKKEKEYSHKGTLDEPLVFNLLGDAALREYVMSYYDFLKFSRNLYAYELPQKVKDVIYESNYILFYGFDLGKWYNILVLFLINEIKEEADKITFNKSTTNELMATLKDKFNLCFIENEQFVDQLFEKAQQKNLTYIQVSEEKIQKQTEYVEYLKDNVIVTTDPVDRKRLEGNIDKAEKELEELKQKYIKLLNLIK